jgi:DNA-binding NarL/FixJ family response regulator
VAITVVIVDDQAAFRAVARELLVADGFVVVGEAADAASALTVISELRPQIVLLDVRLPGGSGIEAARLLTARADPPVVVLVSTVDYTHAVAGCGAAAFIPKARLSGPALRAAVGS